MYIVDKSSRFILFNYHIIVSLDGLSIQNWHQRYSVKKAIKNYEYFDIKEQKYGIEMVCNGVNTRHQVKCFLDEYELMGKRISIVNLHCLLEAQ